MWFFQYYFASWSSLNKKFKIQCLCVKNEDIGNFHCDLDLCRWLIAWECNQIDFQFLNFKLSFVISASKPQDR